MRDRDDFFVLRFAFYIQGGSFTALPAYSARSAWTGSIAMARRAGR